MIERPNATKLAHEATPSWWRTLDSFDRAILRIIQRDNKTPQRTIAAAVNLSAAAVQRRIAAMEAAGIIESNVGLVDTRAVRMTITAIVEVHLIDERHQTADAAKAFFRDAPEVQRCYYVTGGISFVLIIISSHPRCIPAKAGTSVSDAVLQAEFPLSRE